MSIDDLEDRLFVSFDFLVRTRSYWNALRLFLAL